MSTPFEVVYLLDIHRREAWLWLPLWRRVLLALLWGDDARERALELWNKAGRPAVRR